jgi:SAM-dependent methyltransferase
VSATTVTASPTATGRFELRTHRGDVLPLFVDRWFGRADAVDDEVLDRVVPPVLDVGCGPARHTVALVARGVLTLGVDIARTAVRLAVDRGAPVLHRSVFDPLPGEGSWGTVLLLDGNLGIGADPEALLSRTRELLRHGGRALVEAEAPGVGGEPLLVAVEDEGSVGEWVAWARVGVDAIDRYAHDAGFDVREVWSREGRWFSHLDAR